MSDKKTEGAPPDAAAAAAPAPAASGGLKAWLPLLVTVVVMPILAFATTKFLILPKVLHARGNAAEPEAGPAGEDHEGTKQEPKEGQEHGESKKDDHGAKPEKPEKGKEGKGKKQTAQLTKIIVNVSGSMGTRYLMSSITLVGTRAGFKEMIEENKDQLLDLANTALASRTITDLEKPGSRNLIRSELISIFNNALGANAVQEIYFTEFAIQ